MGGRWQQVFSWIQRTHHSSRLQRTLRGIFWSQCDFSQVSAYPGVWLFLLMSEKMGNWIIESLSKYSNTLEAGGPPVAGLWLVWLCSRTLHLDSLCVRMPGECLTGRHCVLAGAPRTEVLEQQSGPSAPLACCQVSWNIFWFKFSVFVKMEMSLGGVKSHFLWGVCMRVLFEERKSMLGKL